MPPNRPLTPTSLPHLDIMLTDDGSRTLRDRVLDETYHSGCGALSECWHVYLLNSGIEARLVAAASNASFASPVRVLELGFGTGMGWLVTAAVAESFGAALEFVSLERHLLPADILAQIDSTAAIQRGMADGWLPDTLNVIEPLERAWLDHRRTIDPAFEFGREFVYDVSPTNRLRLWLGDARQWLDSAQPHLFDAIYFDAFSPGTNPELWHTEMFDAMKKLLMPQGKLVSYCVSGAVRRALQQAGFTVERLPGPPGGKREVLVAFLEC